MHQDTSVAKQYLCAGVARWKGELQAPCDIDGKSLVRDTVPVERGRDDALDGGVAVVVRVS